VHLTRNTWHPWQWHSQLEQVDNTTSTTAPMRTPWRTCSGHTPSRASHHTTSTSGRLMPLVIRTSLVAGGHWLNQRQQSWWERSKTERTTRTTIIWSCTSITRMETMRAISQQWRLDNTWQRVERVCIRQCWGSLSKKARRSQKTVQLVDNATHVVTTAAAAFGHGSSSSYFLWVDSQVEC